jgi:hypothetical protein
LATYESEIELEKTCKSLEIETNTAPPAALLAPGLHDEDEEIEWLLLKLQCAMDSAEHCDVAGTVSDSCLG